MPQLLECKKYVLPVRFLGNLHMSSLSPCVFDWLEGCLSTTLSPHHPLHQTGGALQARAGTPFCFNRLAKLLHTGSEQLLTVTWIYLLGWGGWVPGSLSLPVSIKKPVGQTMKVSWWHEIQPESHQSEFIVLGLASLNTKTSGEGKCGFVYITAWDWSVLYATGCEQRVLLLLLLLLCLTLL